MFDANQLWFKIYVFFYLIMVGLLPIPLCSSEFYWKMSGLSPARIEELTYPKIYFILFYVLIIKSNQVLLLFCCYLMPGTHSNQLLFLLIKEGYPLRACWA
jgi:hypothetical protein